MNDRSRLIGPFVAMAVAGLAGCGFFRDVLDQREHPRREDARVRLDCSAASPSNPSATPRTPLDLEPLGECRIGANGPSVHLFEGRDGGAPRYYYTPPFQLAGPARIEPNQDGLPYQVAATVRVALLESELRTCRRPGLRDELLSAAKPVALAYARMMVVGANGSSTQLCELPGPARTPLADFTVRLGTASSANARQLATAIDAGNGPAIAAELGVARTQPPSACPALESPPRLDLSVLVADLRRGAEPLDGDPASVARRGTIVVTDRVMHALIEAVRRQLTYTDARCSGPGMDRDVQWLLESGGDPYVRRADLRALLDQTWVEPSELPCARKLRQALDESLRVDAYGHSNAQGAFDRMRAWLFPEQFRMPPTVSPVSLDGPTEADLETCVARGVRLRFATLSPRGPAAAGASHLLTDHFATYATFNASLPQPLPPAPTPTVTPVPSASVTPVAPATNVAPPPPSPQRKVRLGISQVNVAQRLVENPDPEASDRFASIKLVIDEANYASSAIFGQDSASEAIEYPVGWSSTFDEDVARHGVTVRIEAVDPARTITTCRLSTTEARCQEQGVTLVTSPAAFPLRTRTAP